MSGKVNTAMTEDAERVEQTVDINIIGEGQKLRFYAADGGSKAAAKVVVGQAGLVREVRELRDSYRALAQQMVELVAALSDDDSDAESDDDEDAGEEHEEEDEQQQLTAGDDARAGADVLDDAQSPTKGGGALLRVDEGSPTSVVATQRDFVDRCSSACQGAAAEKIQAAWRRSYATFLLLLTAYWPVATLFSLRQFPPTQIKK